MTTPHPNADLLRAIADGKQMQGRLTADGCDWFDIYPDQAIGAIASDYSMDIRIKPGTVTINGIECPAPMRKKPSYGSIYYMPAIDLMSRSAIGFTWVGGSTDEFLFDRGLCFATEADAKAVAEAMLKPLREYVARANGEKE